jgi:tetratricopeptide (TPR) repeat protein
MWAEATPPISLRAGTFTGLWHVRCPYVLNMFKILAVGPLVFTGVLLSTLAGLTGCNRSPEAREAQFLKRAEALSAAKDYNRAALELKNASKAMPKDPEPNYRLGLLELSVNHPMEALMEFRKALQLNPNHAGAKLKMAELMSLSRKKEDVEEAARRLTEFVKASPDTTETAEATDNLAFTQWRLGNPEEATKLLEETLAKSPSRLVSSVALARMKVEKKDFAGAEEVLKAAVKSDPKSAQAALLLGRFYILTQKLDAAEAQMKTAIALDPKSGSAWAGLAAIQLHGGRKQEAEQSYQQLSALPDKVYKPVHALFLFQEGRHDEAIAEMTRLAKADPQDRDARGRLVAAYVSTNQGAKAQQVLDDALHRNPKDVDALIQRSNFYMNQGKSSEATADLRQALTFRPDSVDGHAAMANVYRSTGKPLLERQELSRILQLNASMLPARLQLARNYEASGKADAALGLLQETPAPQKHVVGVLIARNWALYALKRTDELRTGIAEGQAAGPSPEWFLQSGALKLMQGAFEQARTDAEEFVKRQPEDARGALLLADTYLAQKQPKAAIDRLRELASQHRNTAALQQIYGDLLVKDGNPAAARKAYEAAKAANPRSVEADLKLAQIDIGDKQYDAAQQIAQGIIQRAPNNIQAQLMLGDIDEANHKEADAISHYRTVLNVQEDNLYALNNLAYTLITTNPDEALKYAQKALEALPDNPTVQDTIGWIYCRKGLYQAALGYLKTSVDHEPTPRRQFHLAVAYLKSGDRERGQALLTQALSKDPNLSKTEGTW